MHRNIFKPFKLVWARVHASLGVLCGWIQGFKWWDCPVSEQVFHGSTPIHLTFMFSKCATIRMSREKEVEQNLEFWVHLRACGFLLHLSPAAIRKKSSLCSCKEKCCQSPEVQRLCSWSMGHFRKVGFLFIDNFSSGSDYREQYC